MIVVMIIFIMIMVPALKDLMALLEKEDKHTQKLQIKEMDQRQQQVSCHLPAPVSVLWLPRGCAENPELLASLGGKEHQYQLVVLSMGMGSVGTRLYGMHLPFFK